MRLATLTLLVPLWLAAALLQPACAQSASRPSLASQSQATQAVAEAYFDAYLARDWSRIEPLLHDDASFEDPTAAALFGSQAQKGKAQVLAFFRESYAGISHMKLIPSGRFFFGEHAVIMGELDWAVTLPGALRVHSRMPFVFRLKVVDNKALEHVDVADYNPFVQALQAARKAKAKAEAKAQAGG